MSKPILSPRPLQIKALELLMREGGARLFLKPGRGKTAVVLKAFDILRKKGLVDCLLVIAPLRVVATSWPQELGRWKDFEHLEYKLIHGGRMARRKAMGMDADVYLMNQEGLIGSEFKPMVLNPGHKRKRYGPNPYGLAWFKSKRVMIAVDESTGFANGQALRSQSLKSYLPFTERRVIMTGTPRPGKLENLWFQAYITDMGHDLGQFVTHFRNRFLYPSKDGFGYDERPGATEDVAEIMAPTTVVSEGNDDDMPIMEVDVWVPMAKELRAQYNELKREFLLELGDATVMAPNAGVCWGKLLQFCQGAIIDTIKDDDTWIQVHDGKLDALEGLLNELDGEPAFVLYSFRSDFDRINDRLGYDVPRVGGGVSMTQGRANCQLFGAGHLPVMLGHPASVAKGIDGLQNNCANVIWFGNTASYEAYYQANLRVARHGSKAESVTVYRIMLDCSVERAIREKVVVKKLGDDNFAQFLRESLDNE